MQTFMAWVKWNSDGPWQRIFDFGNDTTHYTVLTPSAANGNSHAVAQYDVACFQLSH